MKKKIVVFMAVMLMLTGCSSKDKSSSENNGADVTTTDAAEVTTEKVLVYDEDDFSDYIPPDPENTESAVSDKTETSKPEVTEKKDSVIQILEDEKNDETENIVTQPVKEKEEIKVTDERTFIITLYPDKAPATCENFQKNVTDGYYNGKNFYSITDELMASCGEINSKDADVKYESGSDLKHTKGTVSMFRNDENSSTYNFFICYGDVPQLDGQFAAFGSVTEGMDVIDMFTLVPKTEASEPGVVSVTPETPITVKEAKMISADSKGNPRVQFTMNDFYNQETDIDD